MNFLDKSILIFFNGHAGQHVAADRAIAFLSDYHLLKGGALAALIWWSWFSPVGGQA